MAPRLSKPLPPPPRTPEEAVSRAVLKARPALESFLGLLQAGIQAAASTADEIQAAVCSLRPLVDECVAGTAHFFESLCCFHVKKFINKEGGHNKLNETLAPIIVLSLLGALYNAFVFVYMPAAGIAFADPTSMIFHAFMFLSLSSYVQVARTDPGSTPDTKEWRTRGAPPPQVREKKRKEKEEPRWCRKSEAYKPDRAHYCRSLGKVVLKFDHHCPWVANTTGFRNYKFFFLFLLYSSSACAMFNVSLFQLLAHATLPAMDTFMLLGTQSLTFVLMSVLVPFTLFHMWLISRNVTTFEFWTGSEDAGFPYDVGLYHNICETMGANPLLWLFPVGEPAGDGLSFKRAPGFESPSFEKAERAEPIAGSRPDPGLVPRPVRLHGPQAAKAAAQAAEEEEAAAENGADPEAAHPAAGARGAASDVEEEEQMDVQEPNSEQAGAAAPEEAAPAEATVASSLADCFLIWRDAEEFVDDVRVGCEVIEEAVEDGLARFVSSCAACLPGGGGSRTSGKALRGSGSSRHRARGAALDGKPTKSAPRNARASAASTAIPSVLAGVAPRDDSSSDVGGGAPRGSATASFVSD